MINFLKINQYQTIILFLLSAIFLTINVNFQLDNVVIICFFLIATIGVSHGSLDHEKGSKLLKIYKIKNKFFFYFGYIFISLAVLGLWLILPLFILIIFLIVAAYHFGKEDAIFGKNKKTKLMSVFLFFKGSLVILAPLYFNPVETIKIFETLNVELNPINNKILILFIAISLISNFFINKNIFFSFLDSLTIIMLNLNFSPLLSFTIYFCFLHSVRHSFSLIEEINSKNFKRGFIQFLKKAMPLTIITAIILLIFIFFLSKYYLLDSAILKVIFIGLASLTFPHILLEYLLEKNEKRT